MTIEETIYCMKSYLPDDNEHCTNCKYYKSKMTARGCYLCQSNEAHKIAIKLLETWKQIKEEINQLPSGVLRDSVYVSKVDLINLIDKCLSEVTHDD